MREGQRRAATLKVDPAASTRGGTRREQRTSMKVANASLSQMPSHHSMVTRSPNHMCASLVGDDLGHALALGERRRRRVDEQVGLAEGDAAQVLHRAGGEVGDRDQVELVAGVGDVEVVGEEPQRERAGLQGEGGEVRPCRWGRRRASGTPIDVDRRGLLERPDDEGDEVGRHLHRRREADRAPAVAQVGVVDDGRVGVGGEVARDGEGHCEGRLEGRLVAARERPAGVGAPRTGSSRSCGSRPRRR